MRPYEVEHADPSPRARSAAVRSGREGDPRTRAHARQLTIEQRLRAGFELARFASLFTCDAPVSVIFAALASGGVD